MAARKIPVKSLGPATVGSPLGGPGRPARFVPDSIWVRYGVEVRDGDEEDGHEDGAAEATADRGPDAAGAQASPGSRDATELFEKAGPREKIFFRPAKTRAAIVTCGGLCPGLNDVIRSIYLELHYNYGVREILGLRYGYRGLNPGTECPPIPLTPEFVEKIHKMGGTVLGTSRGAEDPAEMASFLEKEGIDVLFTVGGDGTLRGAHRIHEEIARRGTPTSIVGVPKTIDNDIPYCHRTFGHVTSLGRAREVIRYAHNEAMSAYNGVGLVKVMGRDAGFIAVGATLSSQEVNFTLIPEIPFSLDGPKGLFQALKDRLLARHHAVIVVAEGAGQHLFEGAATGRDASGNPRRHDIGLFLKAKLSGYLESESVPFDLKYIDPSYTIRSVPANSDDATLCDQFARRAVHAAMAGRTDVMIGYANTAFFHVPLDLVAQSRKRVDPGGEMWESVLAATGQGRVLD